MEVSVELVVWNFNVTRALPCMEIHWISNGYSGVMWVPEIQMPLRGKIVPIQVLDVSFIGDFLMQFRLNRKKHFLNGAKTGFFII